MTVLVSIPLASFGITVLEIVNTLGPADEMGCSGSEYTLIYKRLFPQVAPILAELAEGLHQNVRALVVPDAEMG